MKRKYKTKVMVPEVSPKMYLTKANDSESRLTDSTDKLNRLFKEWDDLIAKLEKERSEEKNG